MFVFIMLGLIAPSNCKAIDTEDAISMVRKLPIVGVGTIIFTLVLAL